MAATDNLFPFSRKSWNREIIKPINLLCENPDDGCDELDPLEEAEEDHIWTKKDVQDVHDKLIEICEDNEFDDLETPQLNFKSLISDIIEAIEVGWCDCEPDEINLGTWTIQYFSHTYHDTKCCGYVETGTYGLGFCVWDYAITHKSPYHQQSTIDESHRSRLDEARRDNHTARVKTRNWMSNRRAELILERDLKGLRDDLGSAEEALQNAQNALSSCVVNCTDEQADVDHWEEIVDELEEEIDEKEGMRDEAKALAVENLADADAAATRSWSFMLTNNYLPGGWSGPEWPIDFKPRTLDKVAISGYKNTPWGMGPYPFLSKGAQAYTKLHLRYEFQGRAEGYRTTAATIYFTPTGLPYGVINRNYEIDTPSAEWSVAYDTSTYPSPPCGTVDPYGTSQGDFVSYDSQWRSGTAGDTRAFSKTDHSGGIIMTYEDL